MDLAALLSVSVSLFFVLDPFASLPVFLSVTDGVDARTRARYADKAVLVAAIILVVFILIGPELMDIFDITMDGFRVAGGLMLLLMAVQLVFDIGKGNSQDRTGAPWVIVATPILSGPGVITQAILLSSDNGIGLVIVASLAALLVTWVLLRCSNLIVKAVGEQTIGIFSRVIGLLIAAMGVEYMFQGTLDWFGSHEAAAAVASLIGPRAWCGGPCRGPRDAPMPGRPAHR